MREIRGEPSVADYDYRTDFPNGLPWLQPVDLPIVVSGANASILASAVGLPSREAWRQRLDRSPDPARVIVVQSGRVAAVGGLRDLAEEGSVDLWSMDNDIPFVVEGIFVDADPDGEGRELVEQLVGAFGDVAALSGGWLVAAGMHGSGRATTAMAFTRQLVIAGDVVQFVVTPMLTLVEGVDLPAAAVYAAFQTQMECDLECIADGLRRVGLKARVGCYLNVPPGSLNEDGRNLLAGLLDKAQDALFGVEGRYAEYADRDGLVIDRAEVIELSAPSAFSGQ